MKKLFTILTLVALTATISFAQTFGIKAGLNMANTTNGSDLQEMYDAFEIKNNMMLGISVGATGSFEISDLMNLSAELNFTQKGTKASMGGVDDDFVTKINFIDIVPSASFKIAEGFSANVGPYIGFALSGTQTVQEIDLITGETTTTSEAIDFEEDEIGTLDYGLNIGVSYVLNEMIAINAGYSLGLADLNAEGGEFDDEDYSQKTNGIYFSVGYLFGGGY
ncbi:MAG: PorT family protein [Flavobacteriales bacterium]|jgi:long-subunit fatty acid transport protein|nr:PorT family protein [Flavobacteriales bacterium]